MFGDNSTIALYHTKNGFFCLQRPTLGPLHPLALMLVLFLAANICLIAFHITRKRFHILTVQKAYLLIDEPCRFLRYTDITPKLIG